MFVYRWKEEIAELEAAFKKADVNGDGKVNLKSCFSSFKSVWKVDIRDYVAILKKRGIYTNKKQVEELFALADR
jgi:Ca2+-binding EF-hand superfamily protein